MSKSKSKSSKGAVPAQDVLTKVKGATITKPAQTAKAKSKEIAKLVAGKEKKSKLKKVKEPTPESSDMESEDSDSEDAESDDESEEFAGSKDIESEEVTKPIESAKANGTANSVPKPSKEAESGSESDSDDSQADSDESESSEDEKTVKIMNGVQNKASAVQQVDEVSSDEEDDDSGDDSDTGVATAKDVQASGSSGEEEDEDDDDEDEDDSNDESEAEEALGKNKGPVKAEELSKKLNPIAADVSSEADSDNESDENSAESDDSEDSGDSEEESSDGDDEEEDEARPVQAAKVKRKAEDVVAPAAKKSKTTEAGAKDGQGGNLFVGNLSWNVDEEWLSREFEEFGELSGVRVITDRATGRSKGFGYVEFANASDAAKAHAAKKGALVDNRPLNVDFANKRSNDGQQDRAPSRAKAFGDSISPPSDTLFVGNLSFDAGQETVSEAFSEWGTILGVRLPTDRDTGEPKGYGYVTFASVDEAKAALENMQNVDIAGRACRLDFSLPRPQSGESRGRGGGFGGRGSGRGGFGGRGHGGRGGFSDRGGGRGGRGRGGFADRGGRGGRGGTTNRGGFGDFAGTKVTF